MSALYVIGIGPGDADGMTAEARASLARCEAVYGYTAYIDLVRPCVPTGTDLVSTPMTREVERCRLALESAASGRTTAMVCSGDAGVYGMASPVLELASSYPSVKVEVISGVTAAQSGAALLGAPLAHDYVVISLSDLLTPWETIERRLEAAAAGDFCICLYNPRSSRRSWTLAKAAEILLRTLPADRPCGWARNIGREGESCGTCTLSELAELEADMFTTVFVGNSATRMIDGRLVTPRGYREAGRSEDAESPADGASGLHAVQDER